MSWFSTRTFSRTLLQFITIFQEQLLKIYLRADLSCSFLLSLPGLFCSSPSYQMVWWRINCFLSFSIPPSPQTSSYCCRYMWEMFSLSVPEWIISKMRKIKINNYSQEWKHWMSNYLTSKVLECCLFGFEFFKVQVVHFLRSYCKHTLFKML